MARAVARYRIFAGWHGHDYFADSAEFKSIVDHSRELPVAREGFRQLKLPDRPVPVVITEEEWADLLKTYAML